MSQLLLNLNRECRRLNYPVPLSYCLKKSSRCMGLRFDPARPDRYEIEIAEWVSR